MRVLVCNSTKKEFKDIENESGCITKHLKSISTNVPSSYIRRKYLKENGVYWHFQFFSIKNIIEKDKFKCKYCDWDTYDLNNDSGCYTAHLKKNHKKDIKSYLKDFPDEYYKFSTFLKKEKKEKETLKNNNHVICNICEKKVRYLTNTHLKKHNITPEEYKLKYSNKEYASINFIKKSSAILEGASKNIKRTYVSKPEKDLKKFIEEDLGIEILKNDRKVFNGVEIDIIIPKMSICFEFNGNLYHAENYGKKKKKFHLNKTEICNNKNYKLIHITEDEWFLKNLIVKEKIKSILNLNDKKSVYARKCVIKEIDSKSKYEFLNKNHIQGEDKSKIHLGAFYDSKLVSVITFSSSRNMTNKDYDDKSYEIKRFASDINLKVVGIFSKFVSFFKKNYEFNTIFTFLDLRWNSDKINNVYAKNGFELIKQLDPDYTYYNSKVSRYKRFHKFGYGKSSIKKKFPGIYDINKTEWEMMQESGFDRIWDCGKYKYEISTKNKKPLTI